MSLCSKKRSCHFAKEGYPIVFPVDHNNYINKQTEINKGKNSHLLDFHLLNFLNVRVPQALIRISPQAVAKTASNMTSQFIFSYILYPLPPYAVFLGHFLGEFP